MQRPKMFPHPKPHDPPCITDASIRLLSESICHLAKAVLLLVDQKPKPRVRFEWAVGLAVTKAQEENTMLEIKITNEQQIPVKLTPKTDTGKPAKLDGVPTWEVISGNSTVKASDDGLSAMLVSSDDPGDTEILVKADADLGEGVEEISDIIKLSVAGATAKNLGLTAGAPEAKPEA